MRQKTFFGQTSTCTRKNTDFWWSMTKKANSCCICRNAFQEFLMITKWEERCFGRMCAVLSGTQKALGFGWCAIALPNRNAHGNHCTQPTKNIMKSSTKPPLMMSLSHLPKKCRTFSIKITGRKKSAKWRKRRCWFLRWKHATNWTKIWYKMSANLRISTKKKFKTKSTNWKDRAITRQSSGKLSFAAETMRSIITGNT